MAKLADHYEQRLGAITPDLKTSVMEVGKGSVATQGVVVLPEFMPVEKAYQIADAISRSGEDIDQMIQILHDTAKLIRPFVFFWHEFQKKSARPYRPDDIVYGHNHELLTVTDFEQLDALYVTLEGEG